MKSVESHASTNCDASSEGGNVVQRGAVATTGTLVQDQPAQACKSDHRLAAPCTDASPMHQAVDPRHHLGGAPVIVPPWMDPVEGLRRSGRLHTVMDPRAPRPRMFPVDLDESPVAGGHAAADSRSGRNAAGVAGGSPALSPIPYRLSPEVAPAPEVAGTARHALDPAKVAAQEWAAIDRALVQMTVDKRRTVLVFIRELEAERAK